MSSKEALDVLGIDGTADSAIVRSAYRRLLAAFHPDRNDAVDATENYIRVQTAYNIIGASSTITGLSWYESLGGSDRMFTGPINMSTVDATRPDDIREHVSRGNIFAAVARINPEIVNFFAMGNSQRGP